MRITKFHRRAISGASMMLLVAGLILSFIAVAAVGVGQELQCEVLTPCQLLCDGKCEMNARKAPSRRMGLPVLEAVTTMTLSGTAQASNVAETMDELIKRVVIVAEAQAAATCNSLNPTVHGYPQGVEPTGQWKLVPAGDWTSGFFPGVLWQLHSLTGKASWAAQAQLWQAALAEHQRDWWSQHDFGFIYLPSFAHSYEVTKSPSDLRQALTAAEALAWAYNPATRSLRTFEGWDPTHSSRGFRQVVIMDFMMNIPLLVWGAKHFGPPKECDSMRMDRDPATSWMNMAVEHARQVAANHLRPDGTSFHIVEYQPVSAEINKKYTYQGYADNSTWARGQSWAIAGFAFMHKETGLSEFLEAGKKVADAWLQLLVKQEAPLVGQYVPKWDFDAPYDPLTDGPRDASAAAVAALGMLHLSEALPGTECGQKYLCAAVNTLRELASDKYLAQPGENGFPALLKHATGNAPINVQIDTGLVYGDYYFLYALSKCAEMDSCRLYGQQQTGH